MDCSSYYQHKIMISLLKAIIHRIKELADQIIKLETDVKDLEEDISNIETHHESQRQKELKLHDEEINAIKKKNQKLKEILEKRLKGDN